MVICIFQEWVLKHIVALMVFSMFLVLGNPAHARGGAVIYGDSVWLDFFAETEIVDTEGDVLTLCILNERSHVFFLGYKGTQEYVFSNNNCEGDSYYTQFSERFAEADLQGLIPEGANGKPMASLGTLFSFYGLWPVAGGLLLFGMLSLLNRRAKRKERDRLIGDVDPFTHRMIVIMCLAAKAHKKVKKQEVKAISSMLQDFANMKASDKQIRKVIHLTAPLSKPDQFKALGKGIETEGRKELFLASLKVLVADGKIVSHEQSWMTKLGRGLGFTPDDMGILIKRAGLSPE